MNTKFAEVTLPIVLAYLAKNPVRLEDLESVIAKIDNAANGKLASATVETAPAIPAVPVKKSVTDEYLICLDDGKKFKSLTRHLKVLGYASPAEYRAKWGLAADYPMVASNYAEKRSELAKQFGLGKHTGKRGRTRKVA